MNVEILSQFPSPPVPNLPALAMAMAPVMPQQPQHQQPMMTQPPVPMSMAMPTPAPAVMGRAPPGTPLPSAQLPTNFITNFPHLQVSHPANEPTKPLHSIYRCMWFHFTLCIIVMYKRLTVVCAFILCLLWSCVHRLGGVFRGKQTMMTSRTSRRPPGQEEGTSPSLSSRGSQGKPSPPPHPLCTRTGTVLTGLTD